MRALILAAGYATRMYPLTLDRPKPLLPVGGKPLLDHLLENLRSIDGLSGLAVVTNSRFHDAFHRWRDGVDFPLPIDLIDDGSTSNENRLGAIGDLRLCLERLGPEGDWIVLAGDNIVPFSFRELTELFRSKGTDVVTCYRQPDPARLRRTGVAVVDDSGRVLDFEEKPREPRSEWAVPPVYVYTEDSVALVPEYFDGGNPADAPGHFMAWLCRRRIVHALRCASGPDDIGTVEGYREVDRRYSRGR